MMKTINDVKQYWEKHPLLSYELNDLGSVEYFSRFDKVRRCDDKFALGYWEFDQYKNKMVLDVGCGPGWLSVNYALGGAHVFAIDLTAKAVKLTKKHLRYKNVSAHVREGNVENLDFSDNFFDLVVSSGVLHHTPNTYKGFTECYRVLKTGGKAKITLYYKGTLHKKLLFPFTTFIMRLLSIKHPGANLAVENDVDEFIRQYDGFENPVGIGKTKKEWSEMLKMAGFHIVSSKIHFFPNVFCHLETQFPKPFITYWIGISAQ